MDNQQVGKGNEHKNKRQAARLHPNPTRHNSVGLNGGQKEDEEAGFKSAADGSRIDYPESVGPSENQTADSGGDETLFEGSKQLSVSGNDGRAQPGKGANNDDAGDVEKKSQAKLIGQTHAGHSGFGSAGSQNGSSGYSGATKSTPDNS